MGPSRKCVVIVLEARVTIHWVPAIITQCTHDHEFICDESDLLLNKHVVSFAQSRHSSLKELRGLGVIFHAKKTYFMSATYDAYEKKLLQQTFIYPESEIIVFENLLSLVSGVKQGDFDLKSEVEKEVL